MTVSVLLLLAVVAVGLLSLSTVTIRAANQGDARRVAEANARLALLMALGDLQKHAGSDRSVTAGAQIRDDDAPPGVTGVWESWRPATNGADDYSPQAKDADFFRGWLLSLRDEESATTPDRVPLPTDPVELLGEGTLGGSLPPGPDPRIEADRIPVNTARNRGHYAWAVMDEGVKARLDLPRVEELEDSDNLAKRVMVAGSPHRDAAWHLDGLENLREDLEQQDRLITWGQTDLMQPGNAATSPVRPYFNDFSVTSRGLLTNTADGGLKEDLSLLFGNRGESLPLQYAAPGKQRLYPERTGRQNDPDTPYWSMLQDYATIYQDLERVDGQPGVRMSVQSDADLTRGFSQPRSAILAPVVARVELVFSLVARNAHGPWANRVPNRPYMVHLLYSPVVTLYNPYNVPITFDEIEVEFEDLPIGFQFYRNRRPMMRELASFNQLYVRDEGGAQSKTFGFRLKENLGSRRGSAVIEPGATRVFGLNAPPTFSWAQDRPGDGNTIFDWRKTGKTENFDLARGWTTGMGFDLDWLVPAIAGRTPEFLQAHAAGVLHVGGRDTVNVAFGPVVPPSAARDGSFSINVGVSSGRRPAVYSKIEVKYGNLRSLTNSLKKRTGRSPTFPMKMERDASAQRIYEADATQLKDYSRALAFASFSVRGKTTFESAEWVRSWTDSSPAARASNMDITRSSSQAKYPYEVALRPVVPNTPDGSVDLDAADRGFYFSGHSAQTGQKVAPTYEIPFAPLQSVAQLRHANLSASGNLPAVAYTVGESRLHPLLPADNVEQGRLLDHTWLANDALWDGYFFSTLAAEQGLAFGPASRSRETVVNEFLAGTAPLPNPRFRRAPGGLATAEETAAVLLSREEGYRRAAEFLIQDGDFNVNSTSVEAWLAVLGGLDQQTLSLFTLDGDGGNRGGRFEERIETAIDSAFPRVRRPLDGSIERAGGGLDRDVYWAGFRELPAVGQDADLRLLAEQIVQVVKERGPFLSLGEFVNRQLGSPSEEASLKGALQTAIDRAGLNAGTTAIDGRPMGPNVAADYGYTTPEAVEGSTADGYPGDLTQGDLLSVIGSRISVRSDTFTIRAYGDATDASGQVIARAWCEATVQRIPRFVDPEDAPATPQADLRQVNRDFGRRFLITGFRWLSPDEV